jgi:hypothetical protein
VNLDLALNALEGLVQGPLDVRTDDDGTIEIRASRASFRELARLCLLLGGQDSDGESFDLTPGMHTTSGSPRLRLVNDAPVS